MAAMESDGGVFRPLGFGFTGSDEAFEIMQRIGHLLDRIDAGRISRGGGGADIGPLQRDGVPVMGLQVDGTRYFWYHHTHADTIDKLDPREVGLSVGRDSLCGRRSARPIAAIGACPLTRVAP